MSFHEIRGNIHMHTTYSDGAGSFEDLTRAAARVGLDFVYVTDHNVMVRDQEEGLRHGVLTLVGQEIDDLNRVPRRNHLLCLGIETDVNVHAADPQALIDAVMAQPNGLTFLAHPIDEVTHLFQDRYDWVNWEVTGYTGIELWNYMAAFKSHTTSRPQAVLTGYFPHLFTVGPLSATLALWDDLCRTRPVVALGGTDVHAKRLRVGIFSRIFLPYAHCARALNTHLLLDQPLEKEANSVVKDRANLLAALGSGHCWVGYDLVRDSTGFRFDAYQSGQTAPVAIMGDTLAPPAPDAPLHLRAESPAPAQIRLLRDGQIIAQTDGTRLDHQTSQPGVYRIEVWKKRWGKLRGWIFSNPIYVR